MESIRNIIIDLCGNEEPQNEVESEVVPEQDGDEKKEESEPQVSKKKEFVIDWQHEEEPGNHQYLECVKEYRAVIQEQQKIKEKNDDGHDDILMITRGQNVSDISSDSCGKVITVDECGWFA